MTIFQVTHHTYGQEAHALVVADEVEIIDVGTLVFHLDGETCAAFAPGAWKFFIAVPDATDDMPSTKSNAEAIAA